MSQFVEIMLSDGIRCRCPYSLEKVPPEDTVCIVEIDGLVEFGTFMYQQSSCGREACGSLTGKFVREATSEDKVKISGNQIAMYKVRSVISKWEPGVTAFQMLKMRFSLRRERLSILAYLVERVEFRPLIETLEKRFQTKVKIMTASPREIASAVGGLGICGRMLCCSSGACERTRIELKLAKQQSMQVHDTMAAGACGRLKCCIGFEVDSASAGS